MGEVLSNFGRDSERDKFFVPESKEHQAKLELRTFAWLVEKYTKPGDTILDPMSGIGTVHYAATMGRNTIAIELVERFCQIQHLNLAKLQAVRGLNSKTKVLEGDCRRHLPLTEPVEACIFSPPYGNLWSTAGRSKLAGEWGMSIGYNSHIQNIGQIDTYPVYLEAMREIYRLCGLSLKSRAALVVVTKDFNQNKKRVYVARDTINMCLQVGFSFEDWHLRHVPRKGFQLIGAGDRTYKDSPENIIEYEDLLVFRRR